MKTFTYAHMSLRRILAVMAIFALAFMPMSQVFAVIATDIFTDGFEAPTNLGKWTAGNAWKSASSGHSGSKSAYLDGGNNNQMLSKNISTVGYTGISVSFWYKANDLDDYVGGRHPVPADKLEVEYTTNGSIWTELFQIDDENDDNVWHHVNFTIPGTVANNNANFGLRFNGAFSSGNDFAWIDDVSLTGIALPPPPTDVCPNIEGVQETVPDGMVKNDAGQCVTPPLPSCPDRYTGTYPECIPPPCPDGYTGTYPECVPPPPSCPDGYTGTYPECTPPPICPDGYIGTYPECLPPPSCPDGYTGTYPECIPPPCPDGYTGTYPECVPPPPSCPDGYTGTYPECIPPPCPDGYTGTYPECVPPPTYACSDDSDNDDDGYTDYPSDIGCTSPEDDDETNSYNPPSYECSDGIDNDDDGYIDESDPGCDDETDDSEIDESEPSVCRIGNNLLANGSFENPEIKGDWGVFSSVADWVISLSDGLELWANGFYGGASDGNQNAELDGNAPTMITQTIATAPGATYELRFDFSARPGVAENKVDALVEGAPLMSVSADGSNMSETSWQNYSKTFVATDSSTDVGFVNTDSADSLGSLIDNAVLCFVSESEPMYTITGYKWNDLNKNYEWDEGEPKLSGWTIEAEENTDTSEPAVYSDVTDEYGYYSIEVPAGSWIVTEVQQKGWIQSAPGDPNYCEFMFGITEPTLRTALPTNDCNFGNYEIDDSGEVLSCSSFISDDYTVRSGQEFTLSWNVLGADFAYLKGVDTQFANAFGSYTTSVSSDTTFTLVATKGEGEGEESIECPLFIDRISSGGSSGSRSSNDDDGEVLGAATTRAPESQVLGASTSVMPVGAPNTGAGGTSPVVVTLPTFFAVLGTRARVEKKR